MVCSSAAGTRSISSRCAASAATARRSRRFRSRGNQRGQELKRQRRGGEAAAGGPAPPREVARAETGQRRDIRSDDAVSVAADGRRAFRARRRPTPRPGGGWRGTRRGVRPGALVQVVPTRRSVCASLPADHAKTSGGRRDCRQLPCDPLDERVLPGEHRAVTSLECRHLVEDAQIAVERNLSTIEVEQMVQRKERPRRRAAAQPRRRRCLAEAAGRGAATRSCRRRRGAPRYRHRETGTTPLRR